ncbi:MAG: transcription termination/antitermination protein NusA [Anaerolineae bacterium]|nr:transcription termination/antitermination protein NusA [Anaerolineae bacterium]
MKSEFEVAFNEITELRSLPRDVVLEALQTALISAYRRDAGVGTAQRVEVKIDPNTGRARIFVEKEVVDSVMNQNTEVTLEKARYYEPEANFGDMVMVQLEGTTKKFGRIAAQTAKQVILQKIREAERNSLYDEYAEREGDLVTGTVQSVNSTMITVSLGRAEAVMPRNQQIPGERYKPHDKVRAFLVEVKRSNRGPQIVVSRAHRNMLRRLLEYEVPEIFNGQVEIKNIAREAGYRSKVAVAALQEGIDPVGACVGMRGIRIQNIVKELHDEKIDVIEWNPNQEQFIAKALSPARVSGVYLEDDPDSGRTAVVIVPDDQLSLAIGREGQNARLAAKLTGWRIDIKSVTEAVQDALNNLTQPSLSDLPIKQPDLISEVVRIVEKKAGGKTVQPEEFTTLARFADIVERRMLATRDSARQERVAEIQAVKSTLPQQAFKMSVTTLDLPDEIIEALQPLENVGEIMWRFLLDEDRLRSMLKGLPEDSLERLQTALDKVVIPTEAEMAAAEELQAVEPEVVAEAPAAVVPAVEIEEEEAIPAAFGDEAEVEVAPIERKVVRQPAFVQQPVEVVESEDDDEEDEDDDAELVAGGKPAKKEKKKKKKERQQRRQLIFDEEIGQVIAKRRRKGGRGSEWDDE